MISRADLADLHAARAPFAGFALIGVGWGGFAAQVPGVKAAIGAGDAEFGLAMFVAAIGAVAALWLAPLADGRLGRRAMLVPSAAMLAAFVGAGAAPAVWLFTVAMLLCAATSGVVDVLANARVSGIEAARGRPLMSLAHATFSFAYALAAIAAGLMREAGLAPAQVFAVLAGPGALLCLWIARDPRPAPLPDGAESGPMTRQVSLVWLGGAVLLVAFMAEQATEGWSALHLERTLGASAAGGATGPAILGITMCLGRLGGQALLRVLSDLRLMALAAAFSAAGALVAAFAPGIGTAYLGFALLGLGVSVLVPLAYAHVGARVSESRRTTAIARISVIGYAGFFVGPPMMGGISEVAGLAWSFAAVAVFLLSITLALAPALACRAQPGGSLHAR